MKTSWKVPVEMSNKSQYKTRLEWKKACPHEYESARHRGLLNEICDHFGWERIKKAATRQLPNGYWTKGRCLKEAKNYESQGQWQKNHSASFQAAIKGDWLKECCAHMIPKQKPTGYWTKEHCIEEAQKYNTKNEWRTQASGSYTSSKRNGWFDDCIKHMK